MIDKVSNLHVNFNIPVVKQVSFSSNPNKTDVIAENPMNAAVTPQYNIKVPISYTKLPEINLPYGLKAYHYKLANGQQVIIVPKEGETVLKTYVGTGSMNEPDHLRGISHYIEHNLFNGSEGLAPNEFFKTAAGMGAYTNASTGFAVTDYVINSNLLNEDDLEKQIKIHSSMLESPKFAQEMLDKEKGIVNSEINMYDGDAYNLLFNTSIKNLYNIKSTSKDLIAGTHENINRLTREDVVDYYSNNYYPANMVTVITGDVDENKTIKLISKYFSGTNKVTHPRTFQEFNPVEKTVRQDLVSDKTKSTFVQIGFSGPSNNDVKNSICFEMVSDLLTVGDNSRLSKALKPYHTSAGFMTDKIGSRPQDPVFIACDAETNEENCEKVLQEMFNQIYSVISDKNFDLEALKKLRRNYRAGILDTSSRYNHLIGQGMLNGTLDKVTNYDAILNSITKEDLSNFVKEYLNLNRAAVTVVHPKEQQQSISFTGVRQPINVDNVSRYRAANNFEIVTNESTTDMSFLSMEFVADNELKNNPAATLVLSKILDEGSLLRGSEKFHEELLKQGISLNASCGDRSINIKTNCSYQDFNSALNSAIEVVYNPNITLENFEYAKKYFEEILSKMPKSPDEKLYHELFKGLSHGVTKQELLDGLKTLTIDDVKNSYNHIIQNGKASITVSAPYAKNPELKETLFNTVSSLPIVKPFNISLQNTYKPVEQTKVLTDSDTKEQAEIIEAFKFRTNRNLKDDVTISLMNIILGGGSNSRLFNDLREKQQLAYHVGSSVRYFDNSGVLTLNIGTTTENASIGDMKNIQKSIDGFNKHIQKMMTEKVTEEELNVAKLDYKNNLLSYNETTADRNSSLASEITSMYGPLTDNEALKMIDKITVDDIYNVANYIFKNKPIYSILATENTLKANEEYFKNLEK